MSEGFGQLRSLEKLDMYQCRRIQSLPESESHHAELFYFYFLFSEGFGMLTNLKDLNMRFCEKLESLPESESRLTSQFLISNFGNLMSEGFGLLWSLTKGVFWQASTSSGR